MYEDETDVVGEFGYLNNKFQFIDRYKLAFEDVNGYRELVIHPPIISVFSVFLLPFIFFKTTMKKVSRSFAMSVYWFENCILIVLFAFYEFLHVPFLYFKIMIGSFSMGSWYTTLWFFPAWILFGLFYLVYVLIMDMKFFVLCLNQNYETDNSAVHKEENDLKSDKIIIYNEIIDVMKCIQFLYKEHKMNRLKRKTRQSILKRSNKPLSDREMKSQLRRREESLRK